MRTSAIGGAPPAQSARKSFTPCGPGEASAGLKEARICGTSGWASAQSRRAMASACAEAGPNAMSGPCTECHSARPSVGSWSAWSAKRPSRYPSSKIAGAVVLAQRCATDFAAASSQADGPAAQSQSAPRPGTPFSAMPMSTCPRPASACSSAVRTAPSGLRMRTPSRSQVTPVSSSSSVTRALATRSAQALVSAASGIARFCPKPGRAPETAPARLPRLVAAHSAAVLIRARFPA